MEPTEKKAEVGPALAVVIIVAVVAIAGIYFYKTMVKDMAYTDPGSTVVVPERNYDRAQEEDMASDATKDMSTSTDIEDIAADLDKELGADLDLSIIDDIDEELLNFDDLDNLDFSF